MEDLVLSARIDEYTILRVSPIAPETYREGMEEDTLGGGDGYFVILSRSGPLRSSPEILAKAKNFESAEALFNIISQRH